MASKNAAGGAGGAAGGAGPVGPPGYTSMNTSWMNMRFVPNLNLGGPALPVPETGPITEKGREMLRKIQELDEEIQMLEEERQTGPQAQYYRLTRNIKDLKTKKVALESQYRNLSSTFASRKAAMEAQANVQGSARNKGTFRRRRGAARRQRRHKSRKNRK